MSPNLSIFAIFVINSLMAGSQMFCSVKNAGSLSTKYVDISNSENPNASTLSPRLKTQHFITNGGNAHTMPVLIAQSVILYVLGLNPTSAFGAEDQDMVFVTVKIFNATLEL